MVAPEPVPASVHARRMGSLFLRILGLAVAGLAGIEAAHSRWATAAFLMLVCILCTFAGRRVRVPSAAPEDPARRERP